LGEDNEEDSEEDGEDFLDKAPSESSDDEVFN